MAASRRSGARRSTYRRYIIRDSASRLCQIAKMNRSRGAPAKRPEASFNRYRRVPATQRTSP